MITNTILWRNTTSGSGSGIFNAGSRPRPRSATRSSRAAWPGHLRPDTTRSATIDGGNNLDVDPRFVDFGDGADDVFGTLDDDVRLFTEAARPIDAGDAAAVPRA